MYFTYSPAVQDVLSSLWLRCIPFTRSLRYGYSLKLLKHELRSLKPGQAKKVEVKACLILFNL